MKMQALDHAAVPLQGVTMVQAGAGSGKTYAIIRLYLRALLQSSLEVRNILTLTFTRAATAELQTRIRELLVQSLKDLKDGKELETAPAEGTDPGRVIRAALHSMDEASIYTIHGFCMNVLEEYSFLCGQPFGSELAAEQDGVGMDITEDYWRRLYQQDSLFISYVLQRYQEPAQLYRQLHQYAGRPDLEIVPEPAPEQDPAPRKKLEEVHQKAKSLWQRHRQEIATILQESEALNRNKYRLSSLPGWFASMDNLLYASPTADDMFERFSRFRGSEISQSCKKKEQPPRHEFFDACDELGQAHAEAVRHCADRFSQWQRDYIHYMEAERRRRSLQSGALSYQDLLLGVHRALAGERGQALAERLRQRFPVALIDEFQDTDGLQYEIFSRIYGGQEDSCMFYVGDPKQAIYSFRGADVFSYMRASEDAGSRYALGTNYRSHPELVDAVNTMFSQGETPFAIEDISYDKLQPHPRNKGNTITVKGEALPPLSIWQLDEAPKNQAAAERNIAAACAERIAWLLHPDSDCKVSGAPLQAKHIAVLVELHRQGDLMREALARHNVVAVTQRHQSVYDTLMAEQLSILLHAVLRPGDVALSNAALASMLLGNDAEWLQGHSAASHDMQQWLRIWQERGFMPMFQHMLREAGVARRVLVSEDGEQRLTDLLQLGELLQAASRAQPDPAALLRYLDSARDNAQGDGDEAHCRRLQSDDNLVQIVTVHASKGLEYAITFCPFHWRHEREMKQEPPSLFYHQGTQATLNLDSSQFHGDTWRRHHDESISERLRLLYVSLTRASHHCTMVHAPAAEGKRNIFSVLLPQGIPKQLQTTAEKLPEPPRQPRKLPASRQHKGKPQARQFTARVARAQLVESFSSLCRRDSAELPDYDGSAIAVTETQGEERTVHTMPAGVSTGICLHKIMECTDFSKGPDQGLIQQQLQANGLAAHWSEVAERMVNNALHTPMFKERIQLKDISQGQRVDEMEFIYPMHGISSKGLAKIVSRHMGQEEAEPIQRLRFTDLQGYLRGFMDLVFTNGERVWLLDYKSNRLGASADDYSQDRMRQAMRRENYTLQYLIYCLALHRMLRIRIDRYDYEAHHGGACYLFLRGLGEGDQGIFHYKPPPKLINDLDNYIGGN